MQITQQVFVAEEWVKSKSNQGRAAFESRDKVEKALGVLKEKHTELNKKFIISKRERNSAVAGLKITEAQVEDQRKKLHLTEIDLATEKQQVLDLKAELKKAHEVVQLAKEALEAKKKASYALGVEETQARLTEEFAELCRDYCAISWGKALDMAGVPADSAWRHPGSIYYDPEIRETPKSVPSAANLAQEGEQPSKTTEAERNHEAKGEPAEKIAKPKDGVTSQLNQSADTLKAKI